MAGPIDPSRGESGRFRGRSGSDDGEKILNSAATFRDVAEVGEAGRVAAEATAALDWGVVPLPMGPNGRKTRTGDDGIAIWSGTQHPDALRYSRISIHG